MCVSVSLLDICIVSLTSFNAQTLYHFTKPKKSERKPFCSQRFHCIVAMIWKLITAFWEFLEDKRKETYDIVPIATWRPAKDLWWEASGLVAQVAVPPICPIQSHSGMYTPKLGCLYTRSLWEKTTRYEKTMGPISLCSWSIATAWLLPEALRQCFGPQRTWIGVDKSETNMTRMHFPAQRPSHPSTIVPNWCGREKKPIRLSLTDCRICKDTFGTSCIERLYPYVSVLWT